MNKNSTHKSPGISRREFAKGAALATAAAVVPVEAQAAKTLDQSPAQDPAISKLSPEGRARFESMLRNVMQKHDDHFTAEQKTRMRKIIANNAKMLDTIYAVPLKNGDTPATVLLLAVEKSTGKEN